MKQNKQKSETEKGIERIREMAEKQKESGLKKIFGNKKERN